MKNKVYSNLRKQVEKKMPALYSILSDLTFQVEIEKIKGGEYLLFIEDVCFGGSINRPSKSNIFFLVLVNIFNLKTREDVEEFLA